MSILSYFSTQCLPDCLGPLSRIIPSSGIAGKHGVFKMVGTIVTENEKIAHVYF